MMNKSLPNPLEPKPKPLKGHDHLLLKQVGRDGKRKWEMAWCDTNVPISKAEDVWDAVQEALAAIRHRKRWDWNWACERKREAPI